MSGSNKKKDPQHPTNPLACELFPEKTETNYFGSCSLLFGTLPRTSYKKLYSYSHCQRRLTVTAQIIIRKTPTDSDLLFTITETFHLLSRPALKSRHN